MEIIKRNLIFLQEMEEELKIPLNPHGEKKKEF